MFLYTTSQTAAEIIRNIIYNLKFYKYLFQITNVFIKMSKDRRGTGGGLTSEQFHDKFCDRTKDEDSLATKLAGWYWLLIFKGYSTEAKKILERDYYV